MAPAINLDQSDAREYGAYYEPTSPEGADPGYEYFQPTGATVSVWSADIQHGGPPTGLLVRTMENAVGAADGQAFSRVTMDILGPVGLGVNRVRVFQPRPGRQISQIAAELDVLAPNGTWRTAARAVAWRLKTGDSSAIAKTPHPPLPASPEELPRMVGFPEIDGVSVAWGKVGFIGTVEIAGQSGRNGDTPAVWLRPLLPLVAGEETSDLASAFTVIDVANGLGAMLDPREWSWMNTDTTVHLVAPPSGPWIGIDSSMAGGSRGYGASFADLYDANGFLGRSAQTVLLTPSTAR
ncbi:thioesterase family protein [Gordonia iterans]|uniref:Thioesterase family protein n=1 Tax=Gordonia iterans TaxID=1004901 RepID=A0A2S0KGJ0_9ACTN|nr:thioesterase family protein [Gordonia iterans]AVM00792.1 thioesterase family protein [Gordonia iterans]